ncbi:hypothetical protein [Celeribacter halophilus]|uniref:hypothetical protein n=1 Tax=Celeribacter halophilus TaxID=576117 RepID=UPI003A907CDA
MNFASDSRFTWNIASDSRFSWKHIPGRWDNGRKIFWCKRGVEIFGYSGDVLTQSNILSQLCEVVDYSGKITSMKSGERHNAFYDLVQTSVDAQIGVEKREMTIFHGTRTNEEGSFPFRVWETRFDKKNGTWSDNEHIFPSELDVSESDKKIYPQVALVAGTGAPYFKSFRDKNLFEYGCTSRAIFQSLVQVIDQSVDPLTGGPAQAVTLGLDGSPKPVGFLMNSSCSLAGMIFGQTAVGSDVDWRDEDFNYINPSNLKRKSGAPKHWL